MSTFQSPGLSSGLWVWRGGGVLFGFFLLLPLRPEKGEFCLMWSNYSQELVLQFVQQLNMLWGLLRQLCCYSFFVSEAFNFPSCMLLQHLYCSILTPSLVTKGLSHGAWIQGLTNAMRETLYSPGGWGGRVWGCWFFKLRSLRSNNYNYNLHDQINKLRKSNSALRSDNCQCKKNSKGFSHVCILLSYLPMAPW